jgi:hypothetical protein
MKIRPVEADLYHADGQTDRQDMTKLIFSFRNFANAPNKNNLAITKQEFHWTLIQCVLCCDSFILQTDIQPMFRKCFLFPSTRLCTSQPQTQCTTAKPPKSQACAVLNFAFEVAAVLETAYRSPYYVTWSFPLPGSCQGSRGKQRIICHSTSMACT